MRLPRPLDDPVSYPEKHDSAMIIQYGHIMLTSASHYIAINFYLRALVLEPDNPTLNLCIAVCYITAAFKRLSPDRQQQLQQGLAFLQRYYEIRQTSESPGLRQEAEFNCAITWHAIGLSHLALEAYQRCIDLSTAVRKEWSTIGIPGFEPEDLAVEAAFGIQSMLALSGDLEGAREVTRELLVL
jgi:general transcription factor 3C polypeptide 3 (transcription factor C subunit 4)